MGTLFAFSQALAAGSDIATKMLANVNAFALPKGGNTEGVAEQVVGRIIQAFISVFGIIFLALMVYGGYKWMMAQGREDEVSKAKEIIKAAIIGLAVALTAYVITYFVVYWFYTATTVPSGV